MIHQRAPSHLSIEIPSIDSSRFRGSDCPAVGPQSRSRLSLDDPPYVICCEATARTQSMWRCLAATITTGCWYICCQCLFFPHPFAATNRTLSLAPPIHHGPNPACPSPLLP
jgi:hypothetical protein